MQNPHAKTAPPEMTNEDMVIVDQIIQSVFDKTDTEEIAEDKKLGTGMIIKLTFNNREYDRDILVVKGDVDGNSKVNIADIVRTVAHYVEQEPLTEHWLEAADMDSNGTIKMVDIIRMVSLYLED